MGMRFRKSASLGGGTKLNISKSGLGISSGDVAIVLVNGNDATCKRIKKDGGGLWLLPNNPAYNPVFYSTDEIATLPVRIIGKVVELRGKL